MPSTAFARKQRPALTQPLNKLYRFIPLTQGQIAIVDLEDFERLSQWVWFAMWNPHTRGFRAARTEERRHVYMHQEIMGFKGVDHRDHNELNNRKENLRKCTPLTNAHNQRKRRKGSSRYKGVFWHKQAHKWIARIRIPRGKLKHIGCFLSEKEAAKAYDQNARHFHRDFAFLNFPDSH